MTPQMITAAAVSDPALLEGLARRVFGEGDRPAGWFARKLRREHVDLRLSALALRAGGSVEEPDDLLGYVLVGTPPSLGTTVRTAGTGVRAEARGQGLGGRLLEAAARLAAGAGYRRMEVLAAAEVTPFYVHHGFTRRLATVTALAFARGEPSRATRLIEPPRWRMRGADEREPVAWLPEAWEGTDVRARHGLAWTSASGAAVTVWLSREGVAWLVHRMVSEAGPPLPELAAELLERLPAGAPVLLPLLPADEAPTHALLEAGWSAAQHGVLLEREIE